MTITDIVRAYENGLITGDEAIEQGMVESLDGLYEKFTRVSRFQPDDGVGMRRLI
ncbi:hypothetical protein [Aureimonas sp. ME7]|uniref:hypothetical protein n=1 Tax=Aureimonas sp. ME7 TaxID=2744252 RepID=UPI0015FADBB9|nr:hypothetical protein [Aureimonas sp. ME7]